MSQPSTRQLPSSSPDILIVGHITCDLVEERPPSPYLIGGTVSFAAATALGLGRSPAVVTRAAPDLDLGDFPRETELHLLPSQETTTFANVYTEQGRVQYSYAQALPIGAADIPDHLRAPGVVLLGPLVNEVEADVAAAFDDNTLVAAVPQGWMRRWGDDGRVFAKPWESAAEILPHLDALILSLEDIDYDLDRLTPMVEQVPIVVVTEYRDGSTLYMQEGNDLSVIKIPPRPATELDPTGAGDVFATAFLLRLQETGDPAQSARFANIAASLSVEQAGLTGVPTRQDVLRFMAEHPFDPTA